MSYTEKSNSSAKNDFSKIFIIHTCLDNFQKLENNRRTLLKLKYVNIDLCNIVVV